jgi:hypothetical protein
VNAVIHEPRYERVKGKTLLSCSCGAVLGKHVSNEQAAMRWMKHVEKERA